MCVSVCSLSLIWMHYFAFSSPLFTHPNHQIIWQCRMGSLLFFCLFVSLFIFITSKIVKVGGSESRSREKRLGRVGNVPWLSALSPFAPIIVCEKRTPLKILSILIQECQGLPERPRVYIRALDLASFSASAEWEGVWWSCRRQCLRAPRSRILCS